ncbi:MAG: alkaline shock response membrane anchor protein AmaP [Haloechinothrix sp.]
MSGLNRPARLNRVLLAVIGILMLGAGAFAVAGYLGRMPFIDSTSPLVPGTQLPPTWVLYVVAAGAVIIGLLCLRWLVAQLLHKPKTSTWRLESDQGEGRTELPADTAVEPFTDELTDCPGVRKATTTLTGDQADPRLSIVISAEQEADVSDIRGYIDTYALPRLRQALDLDTLPTVVEFRFVSAPGSRVVR